MKREPRNPRIGSWSSPLRPATARAGAVVITVSGLALLAACGGSSSAAGSGSTPSAGTAQSSQLLAFAQCMRTHGVPKFPDPTTDRKFPGARQSGVSDSQYQAAMTDCKHLLPNGGSGASQSELQQEVTALLPYAQCMRSHGIANFPDPTTSTNSRGNTGVVFNVLGRPGLDHDGIQSPRVMNIAQQCHHLLPSSTIGNFGFESN